MAAIRSHTTGTTDEPWDAAENVGNLRTGEDASYYRQMFAYQDPDADPATKSAYSYPHHMVSADGTIGKANTRAASSGIGALNGARGGHALSSTDRQGVYNHLSKHIDDAGKDVPDLASLEPALLSRTGFAEYKTYLFREIKTDGDSGAFSGYASTYNKDLQGDRIQPGAFGQTIADKKGTVPILYNHNADNPPIGFSTSLAEDGKGLALSGQLATATTAGADAYEMLKLASQVGFRMGLSIGFSTDDWSWDDANNLRLINNISDLFEVSLTPFPAQPKAFVSDVKTFRDLEKYLREAEHFSRSDAKRIMRLMSDFRLPSRGRPEAATSNRLVRLMAADSGASCLK